MKDPLDRTKLVLHLPPALSHSALMDQIDSLFLGRYHLLSFRPDKNSHVVLSPEVAKLLPNNRLLSERSWGWVHYAYAIHRPESHIMLFRRPQNYLPAFIHLWPSLYQSLYDSPTTKPHGEEEFTDDDGTTYKLNHSLRSWVPQLIKLLEQELLIYL